MPFIRYPGSKAKLVNAIYRTFPQRLTGGLFATEGVEYREPFFGSGAMGFEVLTAINPRSSRVWLNDKDPWMVALWRSVLNQPNELRRRIADFHPTADAFYEFKSKDGDLDVSDLDAGFMKLALHQMSVSGFGAMSGGPLGGREQTNASYPVDCRWNAQSLKRHVVRLHRLMAAFKEIRFTCRDFADVLIGTPADAFVYLDPPYVEKGEQLYKHNMTAADHERMASIVQGLKCDWSLSYDDHPLVRRLYSWATIREIEVTYTNATHAKGSRPKNREVVISRN